MDAKLKLESVSADSDFHIGLETGLWVQNPDFRLRLQALKLSWLQHLYVFDPASESLCSGTSHKMNLVR